MQPGDPETQLFNLKSRTLNFELESRVAVSLCLGVGLLITALFLLLLLGPPTVAAQGGSRVAQVERAAGLLRDGKIEEAERQLAAILKGAPNEAGATAFIEYVKSDRGMAVLSSAGFQAP